MTEIYYAGAGKPPTKRQKQLFLFFVTLCDRNGLGTKTGARLRYMHDYWRAIDMLKDRLEKAGVNWREEIKHEQR
jgi:hypothetical protein